MEEEEYEQEQEDAVSEQSQAESQEQAEPKMVPLAAMLATRKKLQEAEARANKAEATSQLYQEHLLKAKQEPQEEEDPNALVEKQLLKETTASTKRDILETLYQDMNPEAVQKINLYLKPILEKKPWLAASVDTALNRYARAYEIVQDYMHLLEPAKQNNAEGKRIIQNANKPRSPAEIGRSAQPGGLEFLKSVQGKKEFREYRQKMLQGD